jgi:RNA polymerase sigma-70 factor (ECF subfamily)
MMFACCHPGLSVVSQLALILKTLCGFSVMEISKAFLTSSDTIEKRLYRAREYFRENRVAFEIPDELELPARLDNVLIAIYLLFNEGYASTQHVSLIREDLLEESFRLAEWLARHPMTKQPRISALVALMCFTRARTPARIDESGNILLLKNQDRSKWNREWIERGISWLDQCARGEITSYHLEAGIAYEYIRATSYESTDWNLILAYYDTLYYLKPSPIVALNRAVVLGELKGHVDALSDLETRIDPKELENYYLYHAVLGEFLEKNNRCAEALEHYKKARNLTRALAEKKFLDAKIERISNGEKK